MLAKLIIDSESSIKDAIDSSIFFANNVGFSKLDINLIASAVSEISTNIFKYAEKGWLTIQHNKYRNGIDFSFEDKGPGITNVLECLKDGFTTHISSLGLGLGAAERAMSSFSIESDIGKGTRVKMSKWLPFLSAKYNYGFASPHDKNEQFSSHYCLAESTANSILIALFNEEINHRDTFVSDSLKDIFKSNCNKSLEEVHNKFNHCLKRNYNFNTIQFGLISITQNNLEYVLNDEINLTILSTNNNQENYSGRKNDLIQKISISKFNDALFLLSKQDLSLDSSLYLYHPQIVADYLMKNYAKTFNNSGLFVLKKIANE